MNATFSDLRHRTKAILEALERNEPVTLSYRGKLKGIIRPIGAKRAKEMSIADHPAFGMWKDREDMKDVNEYVRKLRKRRYSDI